MSYSGGVFWLSCILYLEKCSMVYVSVDCFCRSRYNSTISSLEQRSPPPCTSNLQLHQFDPRSYLSSYPACKTSDTLNIYQSFWDSKIFAMSLWNDHPASTFQVCFPDISFHEWLLTSSNRTSQWSTRYLPQLGVQIGELVIYRLASQYQFWKAHNHWQQNQFPNTGLRKYVDPRFYKCNPGTALCIGLGFGAGLGLGFAGLMRKKVDKKTSKKDT